MRILPGFDQLTERVLELATPRGVLRALAMVMVPFGIALAVLFFLDVERPFWALVVQVALYFASHWLLLRFFRPGRMAYADGLYNHLLPAAGLHMAAIFFILLATPGGGGSEAARFVPSWIGVPIALYLGVTGVGLALRGLYTAGFDTAAGLYVYYPDEGRRMAGAVYDIIRHPIYGGMLRVSWAFAMLNGSMLSVLLATLFTLVYMRLWVAIEESELATRFGEEYAAYAERVPALYPSSPAAELELLRAIARGNAGGPASAEVSSPTT